MSKKKNKTIVIILAFLGTVFLMVTILSHYNIFILRKGPFEIPSKYRMQLIKWFPFSEDKSLSEWEEKIFKDKVVYRIEADQSLSYVRATSKAAASALYYKIKLDAKKRHSLVSWKWRADKFPTKKLPETLETQNEDDFAARVYVIFPALFFTNSKVLEYVWTETIPVGVIGTSPYSKNIKLIVARSGPSQEWISEERDITQDYMKAFGRLPEYDIGAVAFMTNAEHTGTTADAMYDDIKLGYKGDGR
jgi:hypothetical protein